MISQEEIDDYDKLGIKVFFVLKKDGRWVFERNKQYYDFAPAQITTYTLSPIIIGTDRLINISCQLKKFQNYQDGFLLLVSDHYFPACDLKLTYKEPMYDGWVYDVQEENLKGFMEKQGAWLCPYIKFYYKEPPSILYLKLESISKNSTPV